MASTSPVLLTAEQARSNLECFQCDESEKSKILVNLPKASSAIGEVICRASAFNLPEKTSPPPSNEETFRNPKLHLDVVSTFLATAMTDANYIPNESYFGTVDAAKEFQGFANVISNLQMFGIYMPLNTTVSREFSYKEEDDQKMLLEEVQSFVATSGIDPSIIIRNLVIKAASLTSTEETPTVFVAYHFEGADTDPLLYIFYGIANMLRKDIGISAATANQTIEVFFSKYQLNSNLVTGMAEALAITVVPAQKMTEAINTLFLLHP